MLAWSLFMFDRQLGDAFSFRRPCIVKPTSGEAFPCIAEPPVATPQGETKPAMNRRSALARGGGVGPPRLSCLVERERGYYPTV